VKATFPYAAKKMQERRTEIAEQKANSLTSEEAQKEFDYIVQIARSGATSEAESYLERQPSSNLLVIAKEVGVTFRNNKPSIKAMREAILGKVRESILLSRHSRRD
jgi:protein-tyrosine-phosphatase